MGDGPKIDYELTTRAFKRLLREFRKVAEELQRDCARVEVPRIRVGRMDRVPIGPTVSNQPPIVTISNMELEEES